MRLSLILPSALILILGSCQKTSKAPEMKVAEDSVKLQTEVIKTDSVGIDNYQKETTSEEVAGKIRSFLLKKLDKDLKSLDTNDRKFSFYETDLNDDSKNEYFIRLQGPYFCGSGGCSFYLLNNDFSINTYFTVTNPPIFISSSKTGDWHNLILKGYMDANGSVKNFIHLKFNKNKGSYPANPSLVKKTDLAPGGHDFIMWDDDFSHAKTFTF